MAEMIQMEMYFFDTFLFELLINETIQMEMYFFSDFELESDI